MKELEINELKWAKKELEEINTYYNLYQLVIKMVAAVSSGMAAGQIIIALEEYKFMLTNPNIWSWVIAVIAAAGTSKVMKEYTIERVKELRGLIQEDMVVVRSLER